MKLFLSLALIIFVAETGYGSPACRDEIMQFTFSHFTCVEHALPIQSLLIQVSKNLTTYEAVESSIGSMCAVAESSKCYKELATPIPGPCNDAKQLQHFRNALRVVLTFNEFMCQNNGTNFLEFIKDGGAACYLHSMKTTCYKKARIAGAIGGENYFKDESICKVLEADFSCHHHYEQCENPKVNTDYLQILTLSKERFNCP